MIKLKFRLRTLFVLTAVAALVCLCIAPSEKSPLPSILVQIAYAPSPNSAAVNRQQNDFITSFYATLVRRVIDEPNINVRLSSDPIAELRRLIRAKPTSNFLNSSTITISAWPTQLVSELDELEEILGIACEVLQDNTQLPGIVLEVRPSFSGYRRGL